MRRQIDWVSWGYGAILLMAVVSVGTILALGAFGIYPPIPDSWRHR